jgi:pilus assembly protein CpaF
LVFTQHKQVIELERLKPLLEDQKVTDILASGTRDVLTESDGVLVSEKPIFDSTDEINTWVKAVFSRYGSRLDLAQPLGEVSLQSEFGLLRIHAVLAGECSEDTQVSIRRHASKRTNLEDLLMLDAINLDQSIQLKQIIQAKENFVIVGATGSGKTTLLRAMLSEVSTERIITIEENYELALGGNSISLKTRENNHEGVGEISLAKLLRNALRMRPDRLVIGEARGEELLLLLQSLNTGHAGAGFTLHANSNKEALSRMLGLLAQCGIGTELGNILISNSIHWVIETRRVGSGRKVVAIERFTYAL